MLQFSRYAFWNWDLHTWPASKGLACGRLFHLLSVLQSCLKSSKKTSLLQILTLQHVKYFFIRLNVLTLTFPNLHDIWKQLVFYCMIETDLILYFSIWFLEPLRNVWEKKSWCVLAIVVFEFFMKFCLEILKFQKVIRSTLFIFF